MQRNIIKVKFYTNFQCIDTIKTHDLKCVIKLVIFYLFRPGDFDMLCVDEYSMQNEVISYVGKRRTVCWNICLTASDNICIHWYRNNTIQLCWMPKIIAWFAYFFLKEVTLVFHVTAGHRKFRNLELRSIWYKYSIAYFHAQYRKHSVPVHCHC